MLQFTRFLYTKHPANNLPSLDLFAGLYKLMIKTSCECQNIKVECDSKLLSRIARQCNCNYCKASQAEYLSDSDSNVTFEITDFESYRLSQNGYPIAKLHECNNYGVILVTFKVEGQLYCVINAKALRVNGYTLDGTLKDYSNESNEQRLSRRKNNWFKAVQVT